jgi:hypothetical protein
MAKHGYTVEHGWFQGACSGESSEPMQKSRTRTDGIVAKVRADVAKLLEQKNKLEAGTAKPEFINRGTERKPDLIPFAEGDKFDQHKAVQQVIRSLTIKAEMGTSFADMLVEMADKYHGQPLVQVEKKEPPMPIYRGDKKLSQNKSYTYECRRVEGGRVYYVLDKNGASLNGWIGTQAWRKLENA